MAGRPHDIEFLLLDLAESVGVPSGSMLKALPCHHWMVARPKDSGSLSKQLHRNKCNLECKKLEPYYPCMACSPIHLSCTKVATEIYRVE